MFLTKYSLANKIFSEYPPPPQPPRDWIIIIVHLSLTGTVRPCHLITKVHMLYKLGEELVKYTPVSIISLSLKMPASDNPYKSLRATIPDIPLNTSDTYDGTPNLYPFRICVGADWEMCLGPYKKTGHQPVRAVTNSMAGMALHWRHNDHGGVSNHQPHGCLFNRLFWRRSKKTSKLRVTGLCVGNLPGLVNSPHKGPVTRKMFPFDWTYWPRFLLLLRIWLVSDEFINVIIQGFSLILETFRLAVSLCFHRWYCIWDT